jgi:hypothetical protein
MNKVICLNNPTLIKMVSNFLLVQVKSKVWNFSKCKIELIVCIFILRLTTLNTIRWKGFVRIQCFQATCHFGWYISICIRIIGLYICSFIWIISPCLSYPILWRYSEQIQLSRKTRCWSRQQQGSTEADCMWQTPPTCITVSLLHDRHAKVRSTYLSLSFFVSVPSTFSSLLTYALTYSTC